MIGTGSPTASGASAGRRGLVPRAVAGLRAHGNAPREIEHRNDVHGPPTYQGPKPDDQSRARPRARVGHRRGQHQGRTRRAAERRSSGASERLAAVRDPAQPGGARRHASGPGAARSIGPAGWPHAVTMTAELSQAFRTKREGVGFVLDAVATAFPRDPVRVYTVDGRFVSSAEARGRPLEVGASNWVATATLVARDGPGRDPRGYRHDLHRHHPDRGRTGRRARSHRPRAAADAASWSTPARSARPPRRWCARCRSGMDRPRVSAEGFATIGDAHVWLGTPRSGRLHRADRGRPAGDPRARGRAAGPRRLRRPRDAGRAGDRRASPARSPRRRSPWSPRASAACTPRFPDATAAVVTGLGDFIAADAARRAGLEVIALADRLGAAARVAPAAAVGWLLAEELERSRMSGGNGGLTVIKVGGGLSADPRRARRGGCRHRGRRPAHAPPGRAGRRPVRGRRPRRSSGSSGSPPTPRTGWRSSRWISTRTCWPSASPAPLAGGAGRDLLGARHRGRRRARTLSLDAGGRRAATHVGCHQ